jgi:hypothetical protein
MTIAGSCSGLMRTAVAALTRHRRVEVAKLSRKIPENNLEFAVNRIAIVIGALALSGMAPAAAHAGEIFGGAYVHDVETPLTASGIEKGIDLQLGYRGGRIGSTPLQPYAFAAINTAGETHYGAVGLSARFGGQVYVRPGLGLAIHSGKTGNFVRSDNRIAFGSRILFEPELAVGVQVNERTSVEASWVHMSHGQIFGRHNPGIDNIGVRVNVGF